MSGFKLNVGCGSHQLADWINLDRKHGDEAFPLRTGWQRYRPGAMVGREVENIPLSDESGAVRSESAEIIRASHVLEHFSYQQTADVLREWVRVLKPGGVLKVAVPNLNWIIKEGGRGNPDKHNLAGYLMGGHDDENDYHKAAFTEAGLTAALKAAGLVDIKPWVSEIKDCASLPVSLNLQGTKPDAKAFVMPTIGCAMSVPRVGFMDNFFCWTNALAPLGITPVKFDGAFWGQCLERVMTDMAEAKTPPKYILTIDYDTIFTKRHVTELIRLMEDHPEADAIAPVQVKRRDGLPLALIKGDDGKVMEDVPASWFDRELLKAYSAHFGLTLIRTSALQKMKHPWFVGVPGPSGRWDDDRMDDDIKFWDQWSTAGNSLYLANRVVVGHAQLVATWPDQQFRQIHQHTSDFWKEGPPQGVRK